MRISDVFAELAGVRPRRTGADTHRGKGVWRNGDGENVSLNDSRNVWHDFVTDEGGGVLDLIGLIQGGSRRDALRWLANFAGVQLNDIPPEDRARWVDERREMELDLREARLFCRGAAKMCEEALDATKARFFDPTGTEPDYTDCVAMRDLTALHGCLLRMGDAEAVAEYRWWCERYPGMTWGIVEATRADDATRLRALKACLRVSARGRRPA